MSAFLFKVTSLSEYAVSIQFGDTISEAILQRITSFTTLLREKSFAGFVDAVPAYVTLSVFYDPIEVINTIALTGKSSFEKVANYLSVLYQDLQLQPAIVLNHIVIPVCYGNHYGPDLEEVANVNRLTTEAVITLHTTGNYKVFMIGFVPGFAYLGGMNEQLATPRKTVPRQKVLAGSVGIAGRQTGIYSLDTPGGWQIIGRTPFTMFDTAMLQPSLLKAGDRVTFREINAAEFDRLSQKQYAGNHP